MSKDTNKKPAEAVEEKADGYEEKPEMVEVKKDVLDQMLRDIENLQKGQTDEGLKPLPVGVRQVLVRMIKDKPVIAVGSVYTERDKFGEKVEYINVQLLGEKSTMKMLYVDFVTDTDQVECKIVSRVKKEVRDHFRGQYVTKKEVRDYSTVDTGVKVPVMVISTDDTFSVELPDGNVVELKQDAVN